MYFSWPGKARGVMATSNCCSDELEEVVSIPMTESQFIVIGDPKLSGVQVVCFLL